MSQSLTIAVPSKGRIMDGVSDFFADAGLPIKKSGSSREYVGKIKGVDGTEVWFMSSSEIAAALANGKVHIGVTGEDLLREKAADFDGTIHLIKPLGFGQADVVVAVPESWIDVRTMADLKDVAMDFRLRHQRPLRVATKYIASTTRFFAEHRLADYRIVESTGATEGAPAAGTAELIVDITTTGSTLAANNLKIVSDGIILKSQAQLTASRQAHWTKGVKSKLAHILEMVAAKDRASATMIVRFQLAKKLGKLGKELAADFGCHIVADGELQCPDASLYQVTQRLKQAGAKAITVRRADYLFDEDNPLFDAFEAALRRR